MSGKIVEVAIVIRALSIFETFEMDLTRLAFFSVINSLASLRNIRAAFDLIHDVELKSPDDIGRIFDTTRLFETLKRNGLIVVGAVERTDDDEGGISVALKSFEFADGVVDAEFDIVFVMRNNLKIVEADDRSFFRLKAKRANTVE